MSAKGPKKGRAILWTAGGLALGLAIAFVLGVIVFWAWPAYRKAKSPLGEVAEPPIVLHYLKDSPVAENARDLAAEISRAWSKTLELLGIPSRVLPEEIHVYAYHKPEELYVAYGARLQEEAVPVGIVDLLIGRPIKGTLARLACSLAYGGPGNPVFPRGLSLYLDHPRINWAVEATAYGKARHWDLLFRHPDRLLPQDPWETIFFQLDAPWVSAAPSLESLAALIRGLSYETTNKDPSWEAVAAAFARFVVETYGAKGVKTFWLATGWEEGARALGLRPDELVQRWEGLLEHAAAEAEKNPLIRAKKLIFFGRPSEALLQLEGTKCAEADELRGLAYIALGEPKKALPYVTDQRLKEALELLASNPPLKTGRLRVLGLSVTPEAEGLLDRADRALSRALDFWNLSEENLPERICVYLGQRPEGVFLPGNVIWTRVLPQDIPSLLVQFVLNRISLLGLPQFDILVDGLTLYLAYPEWDLTAEAKLVLQEGRWVQIFQPLHIYPSEIVEAEAGAFIHFILEIYGKEKLKDFWKALVEGASPYKASTDVLGLELPELDQALREWLKQP